MLFASRSHFKAKSHRERVLAVSVAKFRFKVLWWCEEEEEEEKDAKGDAAAAEEEEGVPACAATAERLLASPVGVGVGGGG